MAEFLIRSLAIFVLNRCKENCKQMNSNEHKFIIIRIFVLF
jgi:hypothetical protein